MGKIYSMMDMYDPKTIIYRRSQKRSGYMQLERAVGRNRKISNWKVGIIKKTNDRIVSVFFNLNFSTALKTFQVHFNSPTSGELSNCSETFQFQKNTGRRSVFFQLERKLSDFGLSNLKLSLFRNILSNCTYLRRSTEQSRCTARNRFINEVRSSCTIFVLVGLTKLVTL